MGGNVEVRSDSAAGVIKVSGFEDDNFGIRVRVGAIKGGLYGHENPTLPGYLPALIVAEGAIGVGNESWLQLMD